MVVENAKDEVTTAEGLQMGRTITEQPSASDMRTVEECANDTVVSVLWGGTC